VTDASRQRATALVTLVLSLPTLRALLRYDIGTTTALVRAALALAVAMVAVGAVGAVLSRVPPLEATTDDEAVIEDVGEEPVLEPLVTPVFEPVPLDGPTLEEELELLTAAEAGREVVDEPFPFLEAEES
jgi:hypothetical protein